MKRTICALMMLTVSAPLMADDWPSWRGPTRTGVSTEKGLLTTWPKGGPPLAWSFTDAGNGLSTPSIVKDRLYFTGARGEEEFLVAIDIANVPSGGTPKELWKVKIGPKFKWKGNAWNSGPSASPTVDGNLIFALGGFGALVCVDASGKEVWRKDLPKDMAAEVNPLFGGLEEPTPLGWGFTWTPYLDGDQLIITPGGKNGLLAALDKKTGAVRWQTKEVPEQCTYSSPFPGEIGGKKYYFAMFQKGIAAVTPDGKVALYFKRKEEFGEVIIPTPIVADSHIHITVGGEEKQGGVLVKLTTDQNKLTAEEVYSLKDIRNFVGGTVKVGDHVYGYSQPRAWVCQDFKTGKILWTEERALKQGSVIAVSGMLYCYDETNGTCALVEANAENWKETGRLMIPQKSKIGLPNGKIWTPPVVANGKLYLRDQDLIFCYDVAKK